MRRWRTREEKALGIRWHTLPNGRVIASQPDPCARPGHPPCQLCREPRRWAALTPEQRCAELDARVARGDAERAARARGELEQAPVPPRRVTTFYW